MPTLEHPVHPGRVEQAVGVQALQRHAVPLEPLDPLAPGLGHQVGLRRSDRPLLDAALEVDDVTFPRLAAVVGQPLIAPSRLGVRTAA
ncbi:MAG: hypothetical protein JWP29_4659 [Rhodoferax sp.]|nr:hypothetical protein [Rhodoferax sp.]